MSLMHAGCLLKCHCSWLEHVLVMGQPSFAVHELACRAFVTAHIHRVGCCSLCHNDIVIAIKRWRFSASATADQANSHALMFDQLICTTCAEIHWLPHMFQHKSLWMNSADITRAYMYIQHGHYGMVRMFVRVVIRHRGAVCALLT